MADQAVGALATLGGAGLAAIAMLLVRKLVQTERTPTIVVYFSIASSLIALVSFPFGWVWPTPFQATCLIIAGIAGGVAQILLTESYRHADMSAIAPFEYTSMLLGLALGYLLFGDIPTAEMIIGAAIVISAGIFIIYREHRLGPRPGTCPQGLDAAGLTTLPVQPRSGDAAGKSPASAAGHAGEWRNRGALTGLAMHGAGCARTHRNHRPHN